MIYPYLTRYHLFDTQRNGIIGKTKSPGVGLDSPENIYLGDKFDKLVMAYNITKDNLWRIFTRWNDIQLWHVLCYIKIKYEALYVYNKLHPYVTNTRYLS